MEIADARGVQVDVPRFSLGKPSDDAGPMSLVVELGSRSPSNRTRPSEPLISLADVPA